MELLKELCQTSAVPGQEQRLGAIVERELESVTDEIRVDALGNVIAQRRADKSRSARKLMIAAHMDEIGFVVSHIEARGWLRLVPLGGHDPRNMVAQRVTVCGIRGDLPGLLYPGLKPPHLQTEEDRKKELKIPDFFVDLCLPEETVKEQVQIGAMVTLQRDFMEIGDGVNGKALDDRIAVYVMIRAMQQARSSGFDTCAVATAQEEVGLRGAGVSAYGVAPDLGIALDVTLAADIPGVPEHEQVTRLGNGVAIKLLDSASISHPALFRGMKELAERRGIPHQIEILPRGGTDAGAIQRARHGVPVVTLSVPTRYVHTSIELAAKKDIQAAIDLLAAFLEEGHQIRL